MPLLSSEPVTLKEGPPRVGKLTAKLTAIIHVNPLHRTIHRNNENAQGRVAGALAAHKGAEGEREKEVKRGTLFYDHSLPYHL